MRTIAIGLLLCCWAAAAAGESIDLGGMRLDLVAIAPGQVDGASVTRTVLIGRTPVTRGQFARFVAASGYRTEAEVGASGGFGLDGGSLVQRPGFTWRSPGFPQDDGHPVVLVTWQDAKAFCDWATRMAGRVVDLPSEAEWSLAASQAAVEPPASGGTQPVGTGPGLSAMRGQVHQWCLDWFLESPATGTDPVVTAAPSGTARRVLRGGSFLKRDGRWRNTPGSRNADNGFRIVVRERLAAALPVVESTATQDQPAAAPPIAHEESSTGCGFGALLVLIIGGVVALVVWIARALGMGSGQRASLTPTSANPRVAEIRDDGFILDPDSCPAGRTVTWRAIVQGRPMSGTCTATDAGTYVYTGQRPSRVVLAMAGAAASTDAFDDNAPVYQRHYMASTTTTTAASSWSQPSAY
jgi:sulfatase modifying factor 1